MTALSAEAAARRLAPLLLAPDEAAAATAFRYGFGADERLLAVDKDGAAFRPAAVLVALIARDGEATVLLTRRASHLPDHGGQISFPGGRIEAGDADAVAAALREAEEEVGLAPATVRVLGALHPRGTNSYYRVTPIVAVAAPFAPVLQAEEVAEAFEVPLSFVLDPANHVLLDRGPDGRPRQMYALPFGERYIFGFTARILIQLAELWHAGAPAEAGPGLGRGP